MRWIGFLKKYWLYELTIVAGWGLLWLFTSACPLPGSSIPEGDRFVGFLEGGRSFATVTNPEKELSQQKAFLYGPILIRDTESGAVKQSLFGSKDQLVNLFVERLQENVIRVLRSQEKTPAGLYKYQLEWWDINSGKAIASFQVQHISLFDRSTSYAAALTPDRRLAVYITYEGIRQKVICLELGSGKKLYELGSTRLVSQVQFSPNGKYLMVHRNHGTQIVNAVTGEEILAFDQRGYSWAPNSRLLCTDAKTIWNLETGKSQAKLAIKDTSWLPPCFTADSQQVVSTESDEAGVWLIYFDVVSGGEVADKRILVFPGAVGRTYVSSRDGRYFVVTATMLQWNLETWNGRLQSGINYFQNWVHYGRNASKDFSPTIGIIETESNRLIFSQRGSSYANFLSPNGDYIFATDYRFPSPWSMICWPIPLRKDVNVYFTVAALWLVGCLIIRLAACSWSRFRCGKVVGEIQVQPVQPA